MIYNAIRNLVRYGLDTGLLKKKMRSMPEIRFWTCWAWMNTRNRLFRKDRKIWKESWQNFWIMRRKKEFWNMTAWYIGTFWIQSS